MVRLKFQWLIAAILITVAVCQSFADRVGDRSYQFPVRSNLSSTLYGGCYYTGQTKTEKLEIPIRNRRLQNYRKYRKLPVLFYPSAKPTDRLIFILGGIGGDENACNSKYLAWLAQKAGFSAAILPNSFTPAFVVGVSRTGMVGIPATDAKDMSEALIATRKTLANRGRVFSSTSVVGYSHGALLAAFISRAPEAHSLNIKSFLLINPPLDLLGNIRLIDSWRSEFDQISLGRLLKVGPPSQKLFKKCSNELTSGSGFTSFTARLNEIGLTDSEIRGVLGKALSAPITETILASQDINDREILPAGGADNSPIQRIQQRARERAAAQYSMEEYVTRFLIPYGTGGRQMGLNQLNQEASLYSLLPVLKNDSRVFVMHNEDDFILQNNDANLLEDTFGNRLRLYPSGGHMGNMWVSDNQETVKNWLLENRVN